MTGTTLRRTGIAMLVGGLVLAVLVDPAVLLLTLAGVVAMAVGSARQRAELEAAADQLLATLDRPTLPAPSPQDAGSQLGALARDAGVVSDPGRGG